MPLCCHTAPPRGWMKLPYQRNWRALTKIFLFFPQRSDFVLDWFRESGVKWWTPSVVTLSRKYNSAVFVERSRSRKWYLHHSVKNCCFVYSFWRKSWCKFLFCVASTHNQVDLQYWEREQQGRGECTECVHSLVVNVPDDNLLCCTCCNLFVFPVFFSSYWHRFSLCGNT